MKARTGDESIYPIGQLERPQLEWEQKQPPGKNQEQLPEQNSEQSLQEEQKPSQQDEQQEKEKAEQKKQQEKLQQILQNSFRVNYYRILKVPKKSTNEGLRQRIENFKNKQIIFFRYPLPSEAELEEASVILLDPQRRVEYDKRLQEHFEKIYHLSKNKNALALHQFISGGSGSNFETASVANSNFGFDVTNENDDSLVEALGQKGERDSLKFLADNFRKHFRIKELAFMGADLSREEMKTDTSGIAFHYARGNHPSQVDKMIAEFSRDRLDLEAAKGFIIAGNTTAAEKMVDIAHQDNRSSTKLAPALYLYLQDPNKLVNLLATASDPFRDYLVNTVKYTQYSDPSSDPIPNAVIQTQQQAVFYGKMASKLKKKKKTALPDKPKGQGNGGIEGEEKKEEPFSLAGNLPPQSSPSDSQGDNSASMKLLNIFTEAISAVQAKKTGSVADKVKLVAALTALKEKTVIYFIDDKFSDPQAAMTIAKAALNLVNNIDDPLKGKDAVADFQVVTNKYKTTWDWKMILGAVICAALGFVVGAMIGMAAGPLVAFTALAAGVYGAVIGATLFGVGGAMAGGLGGKALANYLDPLVQTEKAAAAMCHRI